MNRKKSKITVGKTMVSKEFLADNLNTPNLFDGRIVARRRAGQFFLYDVHYEDGDTEEMYANEVRECMRTYLGRIRF